MTLDDVFKLVKIAGTRLDKVRQRLRETRNRARYWRAKAYACGAPRRKVGA